MVLTFLDGTFCKRKKLFRFDDRLREKQEIFQLISEIWPNPNDPTVANKLNSCRRELIKWTKEQGANSAKVISKAQADLEIALTALIPDNMEINRIKDILEKA